MIVENSGHWLYSLLDRIDQKSLLEVGCGEGLDTESDCRSLFEGWHIVHLQETRFSYYGNEKVARELVVEPV